MGRRDAGNVDGVRACVRVMGTGSRAKPVPSTTSTVVSLGAGVRTCVRPASGSIDSRNTDSGPRPKEHPGSLSPCEQASGGIAAFSL